MIGLNSALILFCIFILIMVSIFDIFGGLKNSRLVLYECSLFLDGISEIDNVKNKCNFELDDFKKFKNSIDNFLRYLEKIGLNYSEFFVINNDKILIYNSVRKYKTYNYVKSRNNEVLIYKDLWDNKYKNNYRILSNKLLKQENKNNILLYKIYNCNKEDTIAIGFNLTDKLRY